MLVTGPVGTRRSLCWPLLRWGKVKPTLVHVVRCALLEHALGLGVDERWLFAFWCLAGNIFRNILRGFCSSAPPSKLLDQVRVERPAFHARRLGPQLGNLGAHSFRILDVD